MSLRKLTAGEGYTYLTRQVAAHDSTEKGHTSLADYYDEKGESPGRWLGSGLAALGLGLGDTVTASQMASLFGQGQHPRAGEIEADLAERGGSPAAIAKAIALGRRFPVHDTVSAFNVKVAEAFTSYNREHGRKWNAAIRPEERARIRTQIGRCMFFDGDGCGPKNAGERSA